MVELLENLGIAPDNGDTKVLFFDLTMMPGCDRMMTQRRPIMKCNYCIEPSRPVPNVEDNGYSYTQAKYCNARTEYRIVKDDDGNKVRKYDNLCPHHKEVIRLIDEEEAADGLSDPLPVRKGGRYHQSWVKLPANHYD
jgi:hypothetical protein